MKELQAINTIIREKKIRQADIAAAYGCSRSAINQFISGKRPIPDLSRFMAAVGKVLGGVVRLEVELLIRDGEVKDHFVYITHRIPEPDPEEIA